MNEEIARWLGWKPFEAVAAGWTDEQNVSVPSPCFDEDFHFCERYLLPVLAREKVHVWFNYPKASKVWVQLFIPGRLFQAEGGTFAGALCGAVKKMIDDGWEIMR